MRLLLLSLTIPAVLLGAKVYAGDCSSGGCAPGVPQNSSPTTVNSSANLTAPINTENRSSQENELNQEQSGLLQNTQVNINSIGNYSFGAGIECATPGLSFSAFGSSGNFGGTASYIVPLGGKIGRNCKELTSEILKQRQLDTNFTLIAKCIEFKKAGVSLDYVKFPEFKICEGVTIRAITTVQVQQVVTPPVAPVVIPQSPPVAPTVPVVPAIPARW